MTRSRLITLVLALGIAVLSYFGVDLQGLTNNAGNNGAPTATKSANRDAPASDSRTIAESALPQQARQTLSLIRQGGPFPYEKDGTVFGNREKRLPLKDRGYYREYTVKTPGVSHRGARRIVAGGPASKPAEFYYTKDHYESFSLIVEDAR